MNFAINVMELLKSEGCY